MRQIRILEKECGLMAAVIAFFLYRKKKINDYIFVCLLLLGIALFLFCIVKALVFGAIVVRPNYD